ncbi:2TM domain-containing protein [Joostella sp. CR20]|uniref:2TM domain-containing protein n=1 Tax=Joostella sp. CR20 TaxID=2804312 RepID=UPI00313DE8C2
MENLEQQNKYLRAKERVEELKKFYNGLTAYVLINAFLAGVNYWLDGWNYPWFLWSVIPWGIGIVFNAVKVFGWNPTFSKNWEERKIKEFMEKDTESNQYSRWE